MNCLTITTFTLNKYLKAYLAITTLAGWRVTSIVVVVVVDVIVIVQPQQQHFSSGAGLQFIVYFSKVSPLQLGSSQPVEQVSGFELILNIP